jgi:hypothetical protein
MTASSTKPALVEHVSKAIFNAMDVTDGLDGEAAKTYAHAAIIATLQYARDNVSAKMEDAGVRIQRDRLYDDPEAEPDVIFRAMLEALLQEIGDGE